LSQLSWLRDARMRADYHKWESDTKLSDEALCVVMQHRLAKELEPPSFSPRLVRLIVGSGVVDLADAKSRNGDFWSRLPGIDPGLLKKLRAAFGFPIKGKLASATSDELLAELTRRRGIAV
jgi:hypothetical protein